MRWFGVVVCCLFLTGGIIAQTNVPATAGDQFIFNVFDVFDLPNTAISCHLIQPDGETLDFFHDQTSEYDRFELEPANPNFPTCAVIVKDLKESDTGVWKLTLKKDAGGEKSETFNLNVTPSPEETFLETLDVKWLNPIEYPTIRGQRIDVSLSKKAYPEECYIISPEEHQLNENVEGVTFQDSSYFVSCRVTLGPINDEMLGNWVLCGKRTDYSEEKDRCQLVTISWHRDNNPDSEWGAVIQQRYNHVVNYGSTLSPVVQGSATRVTCHIITPAGEDLVLDKDSDYPNLKLAPSATFICSVDMEIDQHMLGDWTLYGKFRDFLGIHERRLPMNLFLYDENNPYDQAYNVTVKDPVKRDIELGSTVDMIVLGTGHLDSCQVETPSGEKLNQNSLKYEGVAFGSDEESVACTVTLGPMTEQLLGNWNVIGKFSNGGLFTEEHQTFEIVEAEDLIEVTMRDPEQVAVNLGTVLNMNITTSGTVNGCKVVTPSGESYDPETLNLSGVQLVVNGKTKACRVNLGPITEQLLGNWTIIGIFTNRDLTTEEHKTFAVQKEDPANPIEEDRTVIDMAEQQVTTVIGSQQRLTIPTTSNIRGQSCHIRTPEGLQYQIMDGFNVPGVEQYRQKYIECGVTIHVLSEEAIGTWTLIGRAIQNSNLIERRLPLTINVDESIIEFITRDPEQVAVNLGTVLNMNITTSGTMNGCKVVTPSGESYDPETLNLSGVQLVVNDGKVKACRVNLGPITEQLLGNWTIIGRFTNRDLITEEQKTFAVQKEDPLNPIEEDRTVIDLSEQQVTTVIGTQHRLTISTTSNIRGQSCHIRTPEGLQYQIMDGFNVPGVEQYRQKNIECGVTIHVLSEEAIGTWTLIGRAIQNSNLIERRLPFTINVEETVDAIPKKVTIFEGNDLYVRLANPTEMHDTCKLSGPTGSVSTHVVDPLQVRSCGFIIMNVTSADAGTWEITYGTKTLYKAHVDVSVSAESSIDTEFNSTIDLILGQSVSMTVGPVSAVYCRLENLYAGERTIIEGFGNCLLKIESVTARHHGPWAMFVTTAGRVVAVQHQLFVNVYGAETKPLVVTKVSQAKPVITVSCSVTADAEARGCKFRNPHGKVMLAVSTIAEGRYVTSYHSEESNHECSLQITNPLTSDLGVWRCAIDTEKETYYGFMDVHCLFAMRDPEISAVVEHEPILKADMSTVKGLEGSPVTLSSSINAVIRYCYFRASNGTTFSVSPGVKTTSMEYVGAGFDAGECGVTIQDIRLRDQGQWSCHVSLVKQDEEQKDNIQLHVYDEMAVQQYDHNYDMIVEGVVYMNRPLEYCRYVRIDGHGFGFDHNSLISGTEQRYREIGDRKNGVCRLLIIRPLILDEHPWTVATKLLDQPLEISRTTNGSFSFVPPGIDDVFVPRSSGNGVQILLFVLISTVFVTLILGALGPKKNREWTYSRTLSMRQSLRNSFRKRPLTEDPVVHTEATSNTV